MTWPPTWNKPHFKTDQPNSTIERRQKRAKVAADEKANKALAKKRDHYRCRFPLCGCKKWRRHLEASHRVHKGHGGDPAGIRSDVQNLMTMCPFRHRENRTSIHQGNLRWDPLTKAGANGPVVWKELHGTVWIVLAVEKAIGQWELTDSQRVRLERLAEMDI